MVPMTVAVNADDAAIKREFLNARHNSRDSSKRLYQRSENPFQFMLVESLKE
jgi:hypothetical protein